MAETVIRADVAVIGLGAIGAMTSWQLAARGASVVGIERFRPAHDRGSSHGGSRIFRQILFEGAEYVPLARTSLQLWRRLERDSGTSLLAVSGGLVIGPSRGELIADAVASAEAGGVEHERLETDELRARYPQHAVFDDDVAIFEPGAGALRPEAAILAAVEQAEVAGAAIVTDCAVEAIGLGEPHVSIRTQRATVVARRAVVAAGAWFNDLVPELALPLRTQRSCLAWHRGAPSGDFGTERFPVFVRESGHLDGWGIPDIDGRGVKIGAGATANKPWLERPEDNWTAPTARDLAPSEAFVREALPDLHPRAADAAACMNSKTPDGDFIVGISSLAPELVLVGGFSGHGFKHAAGVGRIATELALDGATEIPIERFSPDRFAAIAP